ncbi:hypothetical protein GW17_00005617 [Ensete ventricosum]|nr:hypothetical protein GW17_00005617 [Ensete ventricosum]RZS00849.1 hypothetical protein BHM03_00030622 [Ensete ventricosum]
MHLLRFPNSGIRAKVFIRKNYFKLRVMRLNHVESFYVFLLYFRTEGNEEEEQQGMARPPTRGRRLQPRPPSNGWSPAGAVARKGQQPASTIGCGQPARGYRPINRAVASDQPCYLRWGSDDDGAEGVRASFGAKDDPAL